MPSSLENQPPGFGWFHTSASLARRAARLLYAFFAFVMDVT